MLATGESFPFDFTLTDLSGQNISLAGYQGKVLIVDIWGTWCPPCGRRFLPLSNCRQSTVPRDCKSWGSITRTIDDEAAVKESVQKFMQENGMNYPARSGTPEIQQQVPNFEGFPTTLFIDRTGKVRAKVVGSHDYAFLEAIVKILLEEPAPPPADPAATPPAATPEKSAHLSSADAAVPAGVADRKCRRRSGAGQMPAMRPAVTAR